MSKGKYSPTITRDMANRTWEDFCWTARGSSPRPFTPGDGTYSEETHFDNYDGEGYDSYGYSALDADGQFVGVGNGVDRLGYTEDQYMVMDSDDFLNL